MLVIRLSRTGRRNQPKFRLMLAEDSSKLKGKAVAILGHYIPTLADKPFVFDKEAVSMWISRGAQPSNTVAKLLNSQGFDLPVHKFAPGKPKKKSSAPPAVAAPAAPVAEEAPASDEVPAEEPVVVEQSQPVAEEPTEVEAIADGVVSEEAPAAESAPEETEA